jgi:hypothetical protein
MPKTCGKCHVSKPVDEFHKDSSRKDGLRPLCKDCIRDYQQDNAFAKMVRNSRSNDKKAGRRIDEEPFVSVESLEACWDEQDGECIFCYFALEMGKGVNRVKTPDAATVERVDNDVGHYAFNCVLACIWCNRTRNEHIPWMEMVNHAEYARVGLESWCGICREFKKADEFGKSASRTNGLQFKCKVCLAKYQAKYRVKNRDKMNAAQRLRRAKKKREI